MKISGVILDFYGVIVNMQWGVMHQLEKEYGLIPGSLYRTLYLIDEWQAIIMGKGDINKWRQAAHSNLEHITGKQLPPLHQKWLDTFNPIYENLDIIRALKPKYRIAILANAAGDVDQLLNYFGIRPYIDVVVDSAIVRLVKPDPRIYQLTANRLGMEIKECVFVDDQERNVIAAQKIGMKAIHYLIDRGDKLSIQLKEVGVNLTRT